MFAVIRDFQSLKATTFTALVSGPDDFPPGAGPYGAAVGAVSIFRSLYYEQRSPPASQWLFVDM
jgi:hypothetical protein